MRGLAVGAQNQRHVPVLARQLRDRRPDGSRLAVQQALIVQEHPALVVDNQFQRLGKFFAVFDGAGLGQIDLEYRLALEGRADHEKDEQQEHHVDQRREVDLFVVLQTHAQPPGTPERNCATLPRSIASMRLIACSSIETT